MSSWNQVEMVGGDWKSIHFFLKCDHHGGDLCFAPLFFQRKWCGNCGMKCGLVAFEKVYAGNEDIK